MALDTSQRRASAIAYCDGLAPLYVPNVSGFDSAGERAQVVHLYDYNDTFSDTMRFSRRRRLIPRTVLHKL